METKKPPEPGEYSSQLGSLGSLIEIPKSEEETEAGEEKMSSDTTPEVFKRDIPSPSSPKSVPISPRSDIFGSQESPTGLGYLKPLLQPVVANVSVVDEPFGIFEDEPAQGPDGKGASGSLMQPLLSGNVLLEEGLMKPTVIPKLQIQQATCEELPFQDLLVAFEEPPEGPTSEDEEITDTQQLMQDIKDESQDAKEPREVLGEVSDEDAAKADEPSSTMFPEVLLEIEAKGIEVEEQKPDTDEEVIDSSKSEDEAVIGKRLEEMIRRDDTQPEDDVHRESVPSRVRDIVKKHLPIEDSPIGEHNPEVVEALQEENRSLKEELNRVEDMLSSSRAEREEICIKYSALNERLHQVLSRQGCDDGSEEFTAKTLLVQNADLRKRLEEEHGNYLRRLQAYQDGQRKQSSLVQRLHDKVLQYKHRCDQLEIAMSAKHREMEESKARILSRTDALTNRVERAEARVSFAEDDKVSDYETALSRLDEEHKRNESLLQVNTLLREQLDAATEANQTLASDIHMLTQDWQRMKEDLETKESEWREEEQSVNDYFNAEHHRLLSLWRDAVNCRKEYGDMKSATKMDLSRLKEDLGKMVQDVTFACYPAKVQWPEGQDIIGPDGHPMSATELWRRVQELNVMYTQAQSEKRELQTKMEELRIQCDLIKAQVEDRNVTRDSMSSALREAEYSRPHHSTSYAAPSRVDADTGALSAVRDENRMLQQTLRDIVRVVSSDFSSVDQDRDRDDKAATDGFLYSHGYASRDVPISRSNARLDLGRSRAAGLTETTISAVQSALSKQHSHIEELDMKLASTREQLAGCRKQYDDCVDHRHRVEQEMQQLKGLVETLRKEKQDLLREVDHVKGELASVADDKDQADRAKRSLNDHLGTANSEKEQLQKKVIDLQRIQENLGDETENMRLEISSQKKEMELCHKNIANLENQLTAAKEELVATTEALNKARLAKDILEQKKSEFGSVLRLTEDYKQSLEIELSRLRGDEANAQLLINKLREELVAMHNERIEMNEFIKQLTDEKTSLNRDLAETDQERIGLREELLRLEQEKVALLREKVQLQDNLQNADQGREILQEEADRYAKEARELQSQLNAELRKKMNISDELSQTTKKLNQQLAALDLATKEKDKLSRDRSQSQSRVETLERELTSLRESLASMKMEKEGLEVVLYQTQQKVSHLETRQTLIESENAELNSKKQSSQGQVAQLQKELENEAARFKAMRESLDQRNKLQEKESKEIVDQMKTLHRQEVEKLAVEKDSLRRKLESEAKEIIQRLVKEKESVSNQGDGKLDALKKQIEAMQRDFQERLHLAEADKQRAIVEIRREKLKVQDNLQNLQKDLGDLHMVSDQEKRDLNTRAEQDRVLISDLQSQLNATRNSLQSSTASYEKELKDIRNQLSEAQRQRETLLQEFSSLEMKLKMTVDGKDSVRQDLAEATRKMGEYLQELEVLRVAVNTLKRENSDEKHAKEAVRISNEELRVKIKKLEAEKEELARSFESTNQKMTVLGASKLTLDRETQELRQMLREMEKSRLDLRKETQVLSRQLKTVEEDLKTKSLDVSELKARVERDAEREDEAQREIFALRQTLLETESMCENLRKELTNVLRRLAESDDVHQLKERDLQIALEESHRNEKRQEERRHHFEVLLATANSELEDLKTRLSATDGKVTILDAQLVKMEGAKKEVEHKLSSVYSSLRRYVGLNPEDSASPRKKQLRFKGLDLGELPGVQKGLFVPPFLRQARSAAEVDPESVRSALQDMMQQMVNLERERSDALQKANSFQQLVEELRVERAQVEEKLRQARATLGDIEKDKFGANTQLANVQQAVASHEDTIHRLMKEKQTLSEKVTVMQQSLRSGDADKQQLVDKINKLRQKEAQMEEECNTLRESLSQAENWASKSEQGKRSMEMEMQKLQLVINDKDTENQIVQERAKSLSKRTNELEEQCASLKLTVERLNLSLERSAEGESELKGKLQNLNRSLTESATSGHNLQEKVHQLQRALASSETERQALQERLESIRKSLSESKKGNQSLTDKVQQLRQELSNAQHGYRDLENQIHATEKIMTQHQEGEQENLQTIQKLQAEKQSLQSAVAELRRSIAQLEAERRDFDRSHLQMEKDKNALRKTIDKVERERLFTEELANRSTFDKSVIDRTAATLEKENMELQHRLQTLEAQLGDREQHHAQRMVDVTSRHRKQKEAELDRLRSAYQQAQRTLDSREKSHRQRVIGLEQQVQLLKDQLNQEIRKRQLYVLRSAKTGDEIRELRSVLDQSLKTVSKDNALDAFLLESEARKLDSAVDRHLSRSPTRRPRTSTPISDKVSYVKR